MKPIVPMIACAALLTTLFMTRLSAADIKPDIILRIDKAIQALDVPQVKPEKARKVLVYTHATGFVHSSIPVGAKAFEMLGKKSGAFEVTKIADDPSIFDTDLNDYDAIVLMSTTGSFLRPRRPEMPKKEDMAKKSDEERKKIEESMKAFDAAEKAYKEAEPARRKALLNYVASGKGLIGIHAATDAYHNDPKEWPEFGEMIGGGFKAHPWGKVNVKIDDPASPLTTQFGGKNFDFSDEIYTYKEAANHSRQKLHVLLSVDLDKCGFPKDKDKDGNVIYKGENRKDHDYAVAWIKKYNNGRVFYTLLGHRDETYQNPMAMKFFLDGMQYALGDLKADDSPSDKSGAAPLPLP